jgi:hypothetical protein
MGSNAAEIGSRRAKSTASDPSASTARAVADRPMPPRSTDTAAVADAVAIAVAAPPPGRDPMRICASCDDTAPDQPK